MNKLDTALVLDIIKLAGKSGVVRLKFGDLELEYSKTPELPEKKSRTPQPEAAPLAPTLPLDAPTIERADDPPNPEEKKLVAQVEQIMKDAMLENLQLEDPYMFEQLVAQGELDGEGTGSSEAEHTL